MASANSTADMRPAPPGEACGADADARTRRAIFPAPASGDIAVDVRLHGGTGRRAVIVSFNN